MLEKLKFKNKVRNADIIIKTMILKTDQLNMNIKKKLIITKNRNNLANFKVC